MQNLPRQGKKVRPCLFVLCYNFFMQELQRRLRALDEEFLKVYEKLAIADKLQQLAKLEKEVAEPDIWKNVEEIFKIKRG